MQQSAAFVFYKHTSASEIVCPTNLDMYGESWCSLVSLSKEKGKRSTSAFPLHLHGLTSLIGYGISGAKEYPTNS
jgi:hypothetical protein